MRTRPTQRAQRGNISLVTAGVKPEPAAHTHDALYYTKPQITALLAALEENTFGDMRRSVYDANFDGVVDIAETALSAEISQTALSAQTALSVAWAAVTDPPQEYPPLAHEHPHEHDTAYAGLIHSHPHDHPHDHDAAYAGLIHSHPHDHDASYAALGHLHDDRYYTEAEVDALLAGYSPQTHLHDDRYGRKAAGNTWISGTNYFTPTLAAGAWNVYIAGAAGAARDILIAGQTGYSNGFTVQYTGAEMRYAFMGGNVGVGTVSPNAKLVVSNNSAKGVEFTPDYGGESYIEGYDRNASAYSPLVLNSSLLRVMTGSAERVRVDATGNVGIGTNNPGVKLDVYQGTARVQGSMGNTTIEATGAQLSFSRAAANYITATDANGFLVFQTGGVNRATVAANGNVGVGLTDPQVIAQFHKNSGKVPIRLSYARDYGWELSNNSADAIFRLEYMSGNAVHSTALTASYEGRVGIRTAPHATYDMYVGGSVGILMSGSNFYRTGGDLALYVDGGYKVLFRDAGGGSNLKVGIGTSPSTRLHVAGGLTITGDESGPMGVNAITFSNVWNASANGAGVGTIKMKGAANRDSTGFIKVYIDGFTYYIPYFNSTS